MDIFLKVYSRPTLASTDLNSKVPSDFTESRFKDVTADK